MKRLLRSPETSRESTPPLPPVFPASPRASVLRSCELHILRVDAGTGGGRSRQRRELFEYDDLDRLEQAQVYTTNSNGGLLFTAGPLTYGYDGSVGGTTKGNLVQRTDIGTSTRSVHSKYGTNAYHRITQATGPDYPFPYNDPPIEPVQGFLEDGSTRLFSVQAKPKNDGVAVPTGSFFGEAWAEKRPGAASEEILDMLSTITPGPQAITYTSYHQPTSLSETIDGTSYLLGACELA